MPTIMISIMPDGMPVDQMSSDDGDGPSCPLPTQDEELNAKNRDVAIEDHGYREPNTGSAFNTAETCGSCGSYNQTDEILECIEDTSGDTGYCQHLKFSCMTENTCDEWVEGGPLTSESQEEYKDIL
tara:strand:- start:724 stop:1104 length:381 start_codon:yes stop_codon:yes gene_type:complete